MSLVVLIILFVLLDRNIGKSVKNFLVQLKKSKDNIINLTNLIIILKGFDRKSL